MTDIGDLIRLGNPSQDATSAAFTNLSGTPTDPTAVTLTIVKPDGSKLVYGYPSAGTNGTLVRESAGRFYAEVLLDQGGKWLQRLEGIGAVQAAAEGDLRVNRSKVLA
jgi:hypothetical protein